LSNAIKFITNSIEKKIDVNISIISIDNNHLNSQLPVANSDVPHLDYLKIEVKDTGPGISKVFFQFYSRSNFYNLLYIVGESKKIIL
jgi:signal transduction histidine kinase